ncbi:hypothetical protein BV25DRAFT_1159220 [Artomyces pyxidatus]|uniref:Uncharacterized protein n=1 Tax=Artomyces pyxidatus TaxID=48021 RepID=A0ACB8SRK8_9AGAM|nr:hypothetical protein BV25DRAFT_1159220 [Artomyces pyxidatus]
MKNTQYMVFMTSGPPNWVSSKLVLCNFRLVHHIGKLGRGTHIYPVGHTAIAGWTDEGQDRRSRYELARASASRRTITLPSFQLWIITWWDRFSTDKLREPRESDTIKAIIAIRSLVRHNGIRVRNRPGRNASYASVRAPRHRGATCVACPGTLEDRRRVIYPIRQNGTGGCV